MFTEDKIIPYFPLNITLLPGEDTLLKIFEPRYIQLIKECEKSGITFGIPYVKNMQVQSYGSEAKLKQIVATNSLGEMVITVEGTGIFKVLSLENPMKDKLYSGGKVKMIGNDHQVKNEGLISTLMFYMNYADPDFLKNTNISGIYIHDIARALNLSSEDKYNYIITKPPEQQEKFLLSQVQCLLKIREQEKMLDNDYSLN